MARRPVSQSTLEHPASAGARESTPSLYNSATLPLVIAVLVSARRSPKKILGAALKFGRRFIARGSSATSGACHIAVVEEEQGACHSSGRLGSFVDLAHSFSISSILCSQRSPRKKPAVCGCCGRSGTLLACTSDATAFRGTECGCRKQAVLAGVRYSAGNGQDPQIQRVALTCSGTSGTNTVMNTSDYVWEGFHITLPSNNADWMLSM